MKLIPLSKGMSAMVDDEGFDLLSQWRWHASGKDGRFYAERNSYGPNLKPHLHLKMHRVILGLEQGDKRVADHINGNGLDNRRANLRICTQAENIRNRRLDRRKSITSSRYKGVRLHKATGKWLAAIRFEDRVYSLGYFSEEVEAARAYDAKARELHGDFAFVNFPTPA